MKKKSWIIVNISIFIFIIGSFASAMDKAYDWARDAQQTAEIINGLEQKLIAALDGNYLPTSVATLITRYTQLTDGRGLTIKVPGKKYTFGELIQKLKTLYTL